MVLVSTVAMYGAEYGADEADEYESTKNLDVDKIPLGNTQAAKNSADPSSAAANSDTDIECRLFGKLVTPKISNGCAYFSATSIFSVIEDTSTSED